MGWGSGPWGGAHSYQTRKLTACLVAGIAVSIWAGSGSLDLPSGATDHEAGSPLTLFLGSRSLNTRMQISNQRDALTDACPRCDPQQLRQQ